MLTPQLTRNKLQETAAEFLERKKRLICEWATGIGKSGVALSFLKKHPDYSCLILVPEQNNIENWIEECKKWDVSLENLTIVCYASLHKYVHTSWDLLVLDEAPHIDTEKRAAYLKSISANYVLALGAVISEEENNTLQELYGPIDISKISLAKAISMGILPPMRIYVLHLQLNDTVKSEYLYGNPVTPQYLYDTLQRRVDRYLEIYNEKKNRFTRQKMLQAGMDRKRFLGSQKEQAIRRICRKLDHDNRRYLCFCSSIKQAESIGKERAFTSKSTKSFGHLDKFNNHEINSLFVVCKLIEGQNLKDIDAGIIGQLGGTGRITVQECGRIIRSSNPVIYIPIFDGTKDEGFLTTVTSNIPTEYIKHCKF